MNGVSLLPNGDAWAVGDGGFMMYEHDNAWTQVASPTYATLNAVAMVSPTDGWAVGFFASEFYTCVLLRYQSGKWIEEPPNLPNGLDGLQGIVMKSPTQGWMVGDQGKIFGYGQGEWTSYSVPNRAVDELWSVANIPGGGSVAVGATGDAGLVLMEQNGVWRTDAMLNALL